MTKLNIAQAVRLTGMKPSEIAAIDESDVGDVITITDGTVLVNVPAGQPDYDGKTGLMFLDPPLNEEGKYVGGFPVYSRLPSGAAETGLAGVLAGKAADVLAYAGDHPDELEALIAGEEANAKPRKGVLDSLNGQLAARDANE